RLSPLASRREARDDFAQLLLPPDEARQLDRQVVRMRFQRADGREVGGEVGVDKLEDALGAAEVAEAVEAEGAQAGAGREVRAVGRTAARPSPRDLKTWPPCRAMAARSRASWRATAGPMASGCCSQSQVLPSMSVKRKVSVPDGVSGMRIPARYRWQTPRLSGP